MAEILHEDEQFRFVKLDEHFNSHSGQMHTFIARFEQCEDVVVMLSQQDMVSKPETYFLSATQMEALSNAWIAYQNDQTEKAEAEQQRQIEALDKAYALAESCKAIQIEKREQSWTIDIPDFGWNSGRVYGADELLSTVNAAIDYCKPIQEAYKLAKEYSAIKMSHAQGSALWFVYIDVPNLFGEHAYQQTIVEVVQQAIDTYTNHQDRLVHEND